MRNAYTDHASSRQTCSTVVSAFFQWLDMLFDVDFISSTALHSGLCNFTITLHLFFFPYIFLFLLFDEACNVYSTYKAEESPSFVGPRYPKLAVLQREGFHPKPLVCVCL